MYKECIFKWEPDFPLLCDECYYQGDLSHECIPWDMNNVIFDEYVTIVCEVINDYSDHLFEMYTSMHNCNHDLKVLFVSELQYFLQNKNEIIRCMKSFIGKDRTHFISN